MTRYIAIYNHPAQAELFENKGALMEWLQIIRDQWNAVQLSTLRVFYTNKEKKVEYRVIARVRAVQKEEQENPASEEKPELPKVKHD